MNKINKLHFKSLGKLFLLVGVFSVIISNANAGEKIKITCTKYQWDINECKNLCNTAIYTGDFLDEQGTWRGLCKVINFTSEYSYQIHSNNGGLWNCKTGNNAGSAFLQQHSQVVLKVVKSHLA